MEIWREIDNYDGNYQISSYGGVKTTSNEFTRKERILSALITPKGYHRVRLYKNNKSKFIYIHRLVALYFLPNIDNKEEVNHIDGDKNNNNVNNLEWSTHKENMDHSIVNGLSTQGIKNSHSKLTEIQVIDIFNKAKSGVSTNDLTKEYNVSKTCIDGIKSKRQWKHLNL